MRTASMFLAFMLFGCYDAQLSKFGGIANEHKITCYSGERVIYEGFSTGKVLSEKDTDGYFFKEKGSGRLMEVSGNCVIEMQP